MKPIAVIILNWNGASLLRRYLPSVLRHTPREVADVIVADNGSTDESLEVLKAMPEAEVIKFDQNYGFAEGYNRAIELTRRPYTVLLNSDVEVDDDWLTPLYRHMEANRDVAACQPKILSARDHTMFEYAGASGGFLDVNGYPYCRGRIFDTVETDHGQYDDAMDVDWATGAALMVRSELYLECGGLDASFFAHMEEIDLCWRLRLAGYRVSVVPQAHVYHLGGASLSASNPRKTYLNFRNNLLMMHKNLAPKVRRPALICRRLLDTLAWAKYMATLQWGHANAILRAHRDYARMCGKYTDAPADAPNLLRSPRSINILTSYYLRGRKRFSQLK